MANRDSQNSKHFFPPSCQAHKFVLSFLLLQKIFFSSSSSTSLLLLLLYLACTFNSLTASHYVFSDLSINILQEIRQKRKWNIFFCVCIFMPWSTALRREKKWIYLFSTFACHCWNYFTSLNLHIFLLLFYIFHSHIYNFLGAFAATFFFFLCCVKFHNSFCVSYFLLQLIPNIWAKKEIFLCSKKKGKVLYFFVLKRVERTLNCIYSSGSFVLYCKVQKSYFLRINKNA